MGNTVSAQHTPGPWKAFNKDGKHVQADEWSTDCEGARSGTHAPIKAGTQVVALVVARAQHWSELPDIAPNCHLIAAAPELLAYALCEDARNRGEDIAETVLIRHGFNSAKCTAQEFMDRMRNAAIAKATGSVAT